MELEIIEKRENPLLNRTEIKFRVKHQGEKTPERELVKNDLAEMLKVNKSLIIIDYIRPGFGMAISSGYAKVYKSMEDAKRVEPSYILKRNKFGEAKEEKAEEVKEETREKKESEEKVTEEKEENKEENELQKEGKKTEVTEEKTEEMKKEEVKEEEKGGNP
ncbi:MAG: 30S ribosomal protein S24e [Thermoplasmata archaeon]|nr:MAG: 30S ribosomal protein S24e [Thermoplasmata archaeon]